MTDSEESARTKAFAMLCKRERDYTYQVYADPNGNTAVAQCIRDAHLTEAQRKKVLEAVGNALTDVYYGILLALDGAATLASDQQPYKLLNGDGQVVFGSNAGQLEGYAYEAFHGDS